MTATGKPPFDGLRVLECATGSAGPLTGMMFADYGADVLKVEAPTGDWARQLRGFRMWNRGKRSVVLDLTQPDDNARLDALIARSDVVIVNYRAGAAERLGLTAERVKAINPRAVSCEITGFGSIQALHDVPAYESIVAAKIGKFVSLNALSGASEQNMDGRPLYSAAPIAAYGAAQLAFQGIVAALIARERTGRGTHVETNLLHGLTASTMRLPFKREKAEAERHLDDAAEAKRALQLRGIELTFLTPQCSDGKYIQMCARQDQHFRNWLTAIELPELLDDPRCARGPLGFERIEDVDAIEAIIRERMLQETQAEWMDRFVASDVGADPFLTFDEFLEHPQMTLNDRVVVVHDDAVGPVKEVGPLVLMEQTPARIEWSSPSLGQHTTEVFEALEGSTATAGASIASEGTTPREYPLLGVTIVELGYFLAGPLGSTLLAELGARVIKIEPIEGDPFRRIGLEFVHLQHGKESLSLDLKSDAGKEILHRVVKDADVFFHSFRPGAVDRLDCDYETLRTLNPDLVYLYASSYGSKGAEANRAGFHSTPNALTGGGILQAGEGNTPVDDSYPDPVAGIAVASGIMLGLYARELQGVGQYVETTMLCSNGVLHADNLVLHDDAIPRLTVDAGQHGLHALYRLYPCSDGWLFVAAPQQQEWRRLAAALDHPEWCDDDRFADDIARRKFDDDLVALVTDALRANSADAWEARLRGAGVAAVRADEASLEAFLVEHGHLRESVDADLGEYWRLPSRVTFDGAEGRYGPATRIGESSVALLAELGYGDDEIRALCDAGVVRDGRRT